MKTEEETYEDLIAEGYDHKTAKKMMVEMEIFATNLRGLSKEKEGL